jgi:hypothetical protein
MIYSPCQLIMYPQRYFMTDNMKLYFATDFYNLILSIRWKICSHVKNGDKYIICTITLRANVISTQTKAKNVFSSSNFTHNSTQIFLRNFTLNIDQNQHQPF